MLYGMAKKGDAPKAFLKLSKKGVPVRAILFSTVFSYIAVIFSYVSPDKIFLFLINSSGAVALLVYLVIAFSQLRMRRLFEQGKPGSTSTEDVAVPLLDLYDYFLYRRNLYRHACHRVITCTGPAHFANCRPNRCFLFHFCTQKR